MRQRPSLLKFLFASTALISACSFFAMQTAVPTQPSVATEPPTATQPTIVTEAASEVVTSTPTLMPINLGGPPMEVGSMYPYVDGSVLVAVPGGSFIMGDGGPDNPEHEASLGDFWIYSTEVTNQEYARCVNLGECEVPDLEKNPAYLDQLRANDPVVGVSHNQAVAYCKYVHGRLPSEAEWEKTARGSEGNVYPWGDSAPSCKLLNFGTCLGKTSEVIAHPEGRSYYSALDMSGNVFEWVSDWYSSKYYKDAPVDNPLGPESGVKRSVRSTSFSSDGFLTNSARRYAANPGEKRSDLGFRCVVEDPLYFAPFCETALIYGRDATSGGAVSGADPASGCPKIDIIQGAYCDRKVFKDNVQFIGPPDAVIDSDGCAFLGGNLYLCTSKGFLSIEAKCDANPLGEPSCPAGYTQQGNTCVSIGRLGECPVGYTYDPAKQCCSVLPGQGSRFDLPICPVGTYYMESKKACLGYPVLSSIKIEEAVDVITCDKTQPGGGDNPCSRYTDPVSCRQAQCTWNYGNQPPNYGYCQ